MLNRKAFLFFLLLAWGQWLPAQNIDSTLALYHDNYQQEKIHIHLDRSSYRKGETIWFKAYIMAGEGVSDYSRNFYADWYDEQGQLIKHTIHPVFESSARGQFSIPVEYTGKKLYLKAYTKWMLNFDSAFLYTRTIPVSTGNAAQHASFTAPASSLHFFPEGGDLVNGIESQVAFLAADRQGLPVAVRGAIQNSRNELIDSFASVHDGMGKFSLTPMAGETYSCNWIDEYGIIHSTVLPVAKNSGATLEVQLHNNKAIYVVKRTADLSESFKTMHVVGTVNQQLVYHAAINLSGKKMITSEMALDQIPAGLLLVTVFDANWLPVAERALFCRKKEQLFMPEVNLIAQRLVKRGKNAIDIHVEDTVLSNLSIAITDAGLFHDSSNTIVSQLLLASELKGYIHNPAYYFSGEDKSINEHLDLVMMTHGWRRFKWDEVVKGKLPAINYAIDSDYLQIRGRVVTGGQATIHSGQNLSLIMQAKDSSKQYFAVPVQTDGSFRQRGLIFFDTTRVFYRLNGDKRLNDVASVGFQYSLPTVPLLKNLRIPVDHYPDSARLQYNRLFYAAMERVKQNADTAVTLKEVVVETRVRSQIDQLDEKYTTGLFTSKNGYAFDVINDMHATGAIDVFHYLQNLIPGMSMSLPILGANGAADANSDNAPGINWRDGTPDIYVNEIPSDALTAMRIQMSDVAYVKVFRPPFMAGSGSSPSGAIAIYTRKGGDMKTDMIKGLNSALMTGYTAYREFYHPDYSVSQPRAADLRPTLYWNPYIIMDKRNKTAHIEFYNNDITQKIRIVIEGVNAAGKLARVEKLVE